MTRFVSLVCLIAVISGCYDLRDDFADYRIGMANRAAARNAWQNMQGVCGGINCPHSFREGFQAGYVAVANGGDGCPPAFPVIECHNHMWMDRCSEKEKMEAWYDGYEHGAMAAKSEGMADANRIVTRMPQSHPIDYSGVNASRPSPAAISSEKAIPPTPATDIPMSEEPTGEPTEEPPLVNEPQSSF